LPKPIANLEACKKGFGAPGLYKYSLYIATFSLHLSSFRSRVFLPAVSFPPFPRFLHFSFFSFFLIFFILARYRSTPALIFKEFSLQRQQIVILPDCQSRRLAVPPTLHLRSVKEKFRSGYISADLPFKIQTTVRIPASRRLQVKLQEN
jgi:hypothetical protein